MTDTTVCLPIPELGGIPSPIRLAKQWLSRRRQEHSRRVLAEAGKHARACEYAREGAKLLEETHPGSVARLNEMTLNVADGAICPAAQVFGHFNKAPEYMRIGEKSKGFNVHSDLRSRHMNLAWRHVIGEYRALAA